MSLRVVGATALCRALPVLVALLAPTADAAGVDMGTDSTVIDFQQGTAGWYVVNDGVMGGRSRGDIVPTNEGTARFRGDLSLENNGGFASVRTGIETLDADADGLEFRVRGDGRTYQLRLRADDRFDGVAYRALFGTEVDRWTTVRIAYSDFEPTFRGRVLRDVAALDPSRVRQLGFLLADKNPGGFELEIDRVKTWKGER